MPAIPVLITIRSSAHRDQDAEDETISMLTSGQLELEDRDRKNTYVRVDETGEQETTNDPRDTLASEMADLKSRKIMGEQKQRMLREEAARRGMAPSGRSVRTTSNRGTFFSAYDDPDTALRPVAPELVEEAISLGFTSVMYDCSMLPFEENVRRIREMAKKAHAAGCSLEAEIGHVGSNGSAEEDIARSVYTRPEDALRFAQESGCDALAVAIGTAHGVYAKAPKLDLDCLGAIAAACSCPLVLHGGSGLSEEQFRACVAGGISKINIFTHNNLVAARAAADFYDHVFFVVRVARKQQNFQLLLRALHFSACLLQLFKHHIVELFIEPARVEQSFRLLKCIARRLELAVFFNDRGQALRLLHEFFILRLIGDDLRVAQPKLNLFIARFNLF